MSFASERIFKFLQDTIARKERKNLVKLLISRIMWMSWLRKQKMKNI